MLIAWSLLAGAIEGETEQRTFVDWRDEREAAICLTVLAGEKRQEGARREEMRRGERREEARLLEREEKNEFSKLEGLVLF
ncbi:hypothetical protein KY290_014491 [Solanum tuberosum]|uniref:Secreted protein n=1 Tax=Solanum tuberosum TaxID=4113 RepID=A0ABQ7VQG0_SOLTU|nr:hypothetical protein KY289_014543 [Solanum tuberosum]KAH0770510.1 hypothetical protein KY290_014491 [Solanum tuberosum]